MFSSNSTRHSSTIYSFWSLNPSFYPISNSSSEYSSDVLLLHHPEKQYSVPNYFEVKFDPLYNDEDSRVLDSVIKSKFTNFVMHLSTNLHGYLLHELYSSFPK